MITLANIIYYPIKACRGVEVDSACVERMGLEHDRRMMVVTPEGEFLTQREVSTSGAGNAEIKRRHA